MFHRRKRFFTNRVRLNVVTAKEKFEDVVEYEGNIKSIFNTVKNPIKRSSRNIESIREWECKWELSFENLNLNGNCELQLFLNLGVNGNCHGF